MLVNGDIVQFGSERNASIIVPDAKVFCNLSHERTDSVMVGVLLKTVDADRVEKLQVTEDVYADFPQSQRPPSTPRDIGG